MITRLFFTATLLAAGLAHAQVTCQTYGNTTNCNGSLGSGIAAQPFVNYGAEMAKQSLLNQQAALAQEQAQLARAQTEAIRQQTEALQQQQEIDAQRQAADAKQVAQRQAALTRDQPGGESTAAPQTLQDKYDNCVFALGAGECTDLKQKLDGVEGQAQLPPTHERAAATGGAVPTDKLKGDAATLEAIMRSAPPSSKAFRDAVQSLQTTNEELARRGALK